MKKIEVNAKKLSCSEEQANKATRILNGIIHFIETYGWKRGYRNDMAVNICICCHVLELDIYDVMTPVMPLEHPFKTHRAMNDASDIQKRLRTISTYIPEWDKSYDILDYAIDSDFWIAIDDKVDYTDERIRLISE